MSSEENQKNPGMQSVLKGTYIIGEVLEEKDNYISYSGFNIKKGKAVIILESRKEYPEEPDAIAEESKKLIKSFKKTNASGDDCIENSFFDSDNLYIILASDMLKNSPENNSETPASAEKKDAKEAAYDKPQKKLPVGGIVLLVIICLAAVFTAILFNNNRTKPSDSSNNNDLIRIPVSVGAVIPLGSYEQDNDIYNGKEEVEWLVLAVEDDKALIVSFFALDCREYNTANADITWENCSLRKWLNNDFISYAFSADEQKLIQTTTVTADGNPPYNTSSGNNTSDKVFLLSSAEAGKYFLSDFERQCLGTEYCCAQGAVKDKNDNCWWWLRSPGINNRHVALIKSDGSVDYDGDISTYSYFAIRPAMWINIGS